jgi:CDP-diacylglycerol--serine O-phosphatidyltransferase
MSGRIGLPAAAWMQWAVLAAGVVLALLMVSPVNMFSLKFEGFGFAGNEVRYTYLLVSLVIVLVAGMPGVGLAILLYILYSLVIWLVGRGK